MGDRRYTPGEEMSNEVCIYATSRGEGPSLNAFEEARYIFERLLNMQSVSSHDREMDEETEKELLKKIEYNVVVYHFQDATIVLKGALEEGCQGVARLHVYSERQSTAIYLEAILNGLARVQGGTQDIAYRIQED